jgi:hypothetical protein
VSKFRVQSRRRRAGYAGVLCAAMVCLGSQAQTAAAQPSSNKIPNFAPNDHTSWRTTRPDSDNFLPPVSGPGPVVSQKDHPYVPNGGADSASSNPAYRVADLSNPILKPWVVAELKKANDAVLGGKVPYIARERCYPGGVPQFDIFRRVGELYFIQTPKEVVVFWGADPQIRHIYLNVPHSKNPTPSWYGESVGHYEGDTLVVDTIGQNTKSSVDLYRTPHTEQLHVVERFHLVDGGKTMQIDVHVEDPGAFNMPWNAIQRFARNDHDKIFESICADNNINYFDFEVVPLPHADKPDF